MINHLKHILLDLYRSCRYGDYRRLKRSRLFDSQYYLSRYPDVKKANVNPIFHYLNFGWRELRLASPIFDPHFYCERYNINKRVDPLTAYLKHGAANDHFPCDWFDPVFYRMRYLQQGKKNITPIDHFLKTGLSAQSYPNHEIATFRQKPVLSILVPVYDPDPGQLSNCIRSLLCQSYPHWELCLADDCSSDKNIRPCLRKWAARDRRIKIVFLDEN
ncbi:MAG: glycosyltransferase, partial [Desulforhopalus sp.]